MMEPQISDMSEDGTVSENKASIRGSIAHLKQKFVPGLKYSLLFSMAISLTMLIIGAINVHNCPVREEIPLFLVATGGLSIVAAFVSYCRERIAKHLNTKYLESALYSASLIFLILGMYWVWSTFKPSFDPKDGSKYCNKTAYMFAFVYLTVIPAIFIAIILGFCMFLVCIFFIGTMCSVDVERGRSRSVSQNINGSTTGHQ